MPALSPYTGFQKDVHGVRRLWERFNVGLAPDDAACGAYQRMLLADWRRCHALGVQATMRHGHRIAPAEFEASRAANSLLMATAVPIFREVGRFLADVPGILVLTEGAGTVLHICGDGAVQERAATLSGIVEGSRWNETTAGTNGVGTALARAAPVHVHASEHFCEGWHSWSCAAAPVFDTDGRHVLGIVDFTTVQTDFRDQALGLAVSLADTIQARMALQLELQRRRVLTAFSELAQHYPHDDLLAVDQGGRVIAHSPNDRCRALAQAWPPVGGDPPGLLRRLPVAAPDGGPPIGWVLQMARPASCQRVFRDGDRPALPAADAAAPARFGEFCTTDADTARMLQALARVAAADVTLLLHGETGTGKELLARHVHALSPRRDAPYLAVNCGAIGDTLMESTLFGYVRGAFSGADPRGRAGCFEAAGEGTLFLDEVGELPLATQAALLRVLEDGSFQRVGSCQTQRARCRIVAATHRDLPALIAQGRFRQDLYFRLRVVQFQLKPLRERPADVLLLADQLARVLGAKHGLPEARFTEAARQALQRHRWPGNVRELRNAVEAALLCAGGGRIDADCLPAELAVPSPAGGLAVSSPLYGPTVSSPPCGPTVTSPPCGRGALRDYERQMIVGLLRQHRNVRQVARLLGLARSTLYRKFDELRIDHRDWDDAAPPAGGSGTQAAG